MRPGHAAETGRIDVCRKFLGIYPAAHLKENYITLAPDVYHD
jgi:hypothetical protein